MDIDTRSPSFRTLRSSKRPRSPTSPSSLDRPNKRPSLGGVTNSMFAACRPVAPPALRQRQISEDWVSRTRGLRIGRDQASPSAIEEENDSKASSAAEGAGSVLSLVSDRRDGDFDDINMNDANDDERMSDLSSNSAQYSIPLGDSGSVAMHPLASTSVPPISSAANGYDLPSSQLLSSCIFSSSGQPSQTPPLDGTTFLSPSTPARPMDLQPEDIALPLSPPKRLRLTMGPRLDCEKCRLRVPGHYSHFN
ncbi:hypothetical protein BC835DRAFT_1411174 [Cytidiella melzeri]|nr:hypothetical protein BC835DRAFT_1411174 [Cytidiella melzeri]